VTKPRRYHRTSYVHDYSPRLFCSISGVNGALRVKHNKFSKYKFGSTDF